MSKKFRLKTVPALGECIAVRLGKTDSGAPITALVVRPSPQDAQDAQDTDAQHAQDTQHAEETGLAHDSQPVLRAYLNECQHIPIPIDSGTEEYLSEDGTRLLCQTHGAFYRLSDGLCVQGPCSGRFLQRVALEQDKEGQWWVGPVLPGTSD